MWYYIFVPLKSKKMTNLKKNNWNIMIGISLSIILTAAIMFGG
jgi:hypothetical protein